MLEIDRNAATVWFTREVVAEVITYPLSRVKVQMQKDSGSASQIFWRIYRKGGVSALYEGVGFELAKAPIKAAIIFCAFTHYQVPRQLQTWGIWDVPSQGITGLMIATASALAMTPLEGMKNRSVMANRMDWRFSYTGFSSYWGKIAIAWGSALLCQKGLGNQVKKWTGEPLTLSQLALIGTVTAGVVSVASSPFDVVTILRQTKNPSLHHPLRGSHLTAFARIFNNVTMTILLEKFSNNFEDQKRA